MYKVKVYKEKQFLIFDFEDGKTVKYDFAKKQCIGKKGGIVKDLCGQLRGLTVKNLIDCCVDKQYGKFLRFIQNDYDYPISNIGTILNKVPDYARYEQIFSAGFEDIVGNGFTLTINDVPNGLIKLCKTHDIKLSDRFVKYYKECPDTYNMAYNLEYISLTDKDIFNALISENYTYDYPEGEYYRTYIYYGRINKLIKEFGYTAKALFKYIDHCKTYEAIEDIGHLTKELLDYATMMKKISPKFDKYPRNFLTTHKIACRNYNRLKEVFDEQAFKSVMNKDMEKTFGDYVFIYPNCTQDIKDEAVQQNNCVASYIQDVIDGQNHVLFLRYKNKPDESLVTIEVRNNKIVQALQRFNQPLTDEQQHIVDMWNKWWGAKVKLNNNSKEEMKNAG